MGFYISHECWYSSVVLHIHTLQIEKNTTHGQIKVVYLSKHSIVCNYDVGNKFGIVLSLT